MNDKVSLRDVRESDLETFFTDQLDPEAVRMAAFPSRDRETFMVIWRKILTDTSVTARPLVAEVAQHNAASIRVLRKCGFTVSREARTPLSEGECVDDYVMTLSSAGSAVETV